MAVGGTAITTCPDDDTLAAVAELQAADRAAVIDHAASCESCRSIVGDLLGVGTKGSFAEAETLAASSSLPAAIPQTIGRYRIDRRIGAGAMGVVFAGYDPELARPVAIKVLRSGGSPERMKREAQALAQLAHPNVVAVYDVGEEEGSTFVAMALVDGDNLRTWLETERTTEQIIDAIVQAARGLEVAHAAGIVHRDIKPDNIFVAKNGTVLVGDFGLARTSGEAPESSDGESDLSSSELTRTGTIVGTPAYMAPEQASGEALAATDQFALCVTAWEALYGKRPFAGRDLGELIATIRKGPPPVPRTTRSVPSHVRAAIRRGLATDPDDRHPSMGAFLAAMQPRKKWPYVAAGVVVLGIAATATAFAMRETDEDRVAEKLKKCSLITKPSGWTIHTNPSPAAAEVLARILDRYASEWQSFSKATCIASARRELSELAVATTTRCLEYRKDTLFWLTSQSGDTLSLAESLEPLDTCRDLPAMPAPSPELATLQRDLARAFVQVDHAPGRATGTDELLARAIKLDDQGSIAQANYLVGVARHAQKIDASDVLRAAITAADRAGDDRVRARASALLSSVLATKDIVSESVVLRDAAISASLRANDPMTKIAVERAIADVARVRRDHGEQAAAYRRIEAMQLAQFGELSASLVYTRMMLAPILESAGKPDEAKHVSDLAMEGLRKLEGGSPESELRTTIEKTEDAFLRIPLREQVIALVRGRGDNVELPKEIALLAIDYEFVGDHVRAFAGLQEAIALSRSADIDDIESAARNAVNAAERTDDAAVRKRYVDDALALVERFPDAVKARSTIRGHRGNLLLLAGRPLDALSDLQESLSEAERREPQVPGHIMFRSFALAQALWEVGGVRDRDRALALAAQAERQVPAVRKEMEEYRNGALLPKLEAFRVRLDAWRRTHR